MLEIEGNILDVFNESIYPAKIIIHENKILKIKKSTLEYKNYILPGYIDAHVHIESSLLCPSRFAEIVIPHGTVATVSDPHEIANVLGIEGITYMIEDAKNTPLKIFYTAPSCVPATIFETNGATLTHKEIEMLLKMNEIVALGEVMDYYAVINEDEEMLRKINAAKRLGKVIDGHAPLLRGELLRKYVSFGISTDHESVFYDEALEKAKLGVKIMIREGSVAKNFKELIKLVKENFECFFVTDDILVTDLLKGHIDLLLNEALKYNIDPIKALKCVSLYPVMHYKLPVGLLRENDYADFVIVKSLDNFSPEEVYINGSLVAKNGKALFTVSPKQTGNTVKANFLEENRIKIKTDKDEVKINVIGIVEDQIITKHLIENIKAKNGFAEADNEKDILKIVVVERYGKNNVSVGFIKGFGLKNCAIASSISHDSHNIVAVGDNDKLIVKAVNELILSGGGICLVNHDSKYLLPLPIAGLMSKENSNYVASQLNLLHEKAKDHGCKLKNPFITLSFMTLLVIPEIKIGDKGLFDVKTQRFISVFAE